MMKRGDVYMADLDPVIGSEQGGVRPVLIIQNDKGNRYGTTVIVAAITSRRKKEYLPTHVPVEEGEGGLSKASLVLAEQLRTIEKSRLLRFLGTLSTGAMARVSDALRISLGACCEGEVACRA